MIAMEESGFVLGRFVGVRISPTHSVNHAQIQVVDERALRKKSSSANNGNTINSDSGAGASVSSSSSEFRRMSSSAVSRVSTVGGPHNVSTDSGMDNVNLNDESGGGPGMKN